MLIYTKLIIVFPPNLQLSPCFEVMDGGRVFKLMKGLQSFKKVDQLFSLIFLSFFFIFFIHSAVPENKCVSRSATCYFLHACACLCTYDGMHQINKTAINKLEITSKLTSPKHYI